MDDYNIITGLANALTITTLVFQLVKCFFGYKLGKVLASISGFFCGAVIGILLVVAFCPLNEYFITMLILGSLGLGILWAILSFLFHKVGIFIYMCSTTFGFFYSFLDAVYSKYTDFSKDSTEVLMNNILDGKIGNINWFIVAASLLAGIIMGIITIKYIRKVMVIVTAVCSASAISETIFTQFIHYENPWVMLLVAAALAVLGAFFQFRTTKYQKKRR